MHILFGLLVGYVLGIATPGLIARIRSEAKHGVSLVEGEVAAAKADIKAAEKKL